jgi:hypothetical protein
VWKFIIIIFIPPTRTGARVVGYGPFSLYVTHKEGPCPSSGDINDDEDPYHLH